MATYQNARMKKECIQRISLAMGRQITELESSEILSSIRSMMVVARESDPDAWASLGQQQRIDKAATLYKESLQNEAEKIKKRAYLTVTTQARLSKSMNVHRKRGYRGFKAVQQVLQETDRRVKAVKSEYGTDFLKKLDGIQKGITGLFEDTEFARKVVKEIYGEDTGSKLAKQVATAWVSIKEAQRQRYNSAGGNLGKLDHYVSQTHDTRRLAHAAEVVRGEGRIKQLQNTISNTIRKVNTFEDNKNAWVEFIFPKLDRNKYLDLNGQLLGDDELRDMLGRMFDNIITDGDVNVEASTVAGTAYRKSTGRSNRGDNHRAIHFKDADSFIEYHETFGRGGYFDSMLTNIDRSSTDIALLENLGPNPNASFRGLMRVASAEANQANSIQGMIGSMDFGSEKFTQAMYDNLNGDANMVSPGRSIFSGAFLAGYSQAARNTEVFGKLQSALISSVSDIPMYYVQARMMGIPASTATVNLVKAFGSSYAKELAIRGGLMADTLASTNIRWGESNIGTGITAKLANFTMKVSLLDAFTNGVRKASMMNTMGAMANIVKHDWDSLSPYQKRSLERIGVSKKDWLIWQKAKSYDVEGAKFLTKEDIREIEIDIVKNGELKLKGEGITQRDIDRAVTNYIAFVQDESFIASLAPDLKTKTMSNFGWQKGTVSGEVVRCLMLFKSFPIGLMLRHTERMADINQTKGRASSVGYFATIFTTTTLAGAIAEQLSALSSGKDLQDVNSSQFLLRSMARGGGLGFLTDFIVAGINGENAYGSPTMLRALGPVFGSAADIGNIISSGVSEGFYDKETNTAAKVLKFARGHTPFVNLWYTKAVFDRMIYNDLMEFISPGYMDRIQSWSVRNTGQDFYWNPMDVGDIRMPRMSEVPE